MKKHIIAAAVAAAVAVPAMAQVSITGYLEAGFVSNDVDSTQAGAPATATVKQSKLGGDPFGTPNITFSGSEDLGGGLKASFQITEEFTNNDGEHGATFEQSWVGLSGGFGAIRIGKLSDPAQEAGAKYRFFGDVGRTSMRDGGNESNSLLFISPAYSGFTASLFRQQAGSSAANVDGAEATGVLLAGKVSGIDLGISYQKYNTDGTDNNDDIRQGISANYDFGIVKVGLAHLSTEDDSSASNEKTKMTAFHLVAPVGKNFSVGVAFNRYKDDDADLGTNHIAAKYVLSKRTAVNFAYETAKGEATIPNSAGTATNGILTCYLANAKCTGAAISVSHSF